METIVLSINGKKVPCPIGKTILTAARENRIYIPTLCHHPDLAPYGACRLCLVEDEKTGRLMASCVTPATQGMAVQTDSPAVIRHRKNIVRLMMAEHPESCLVCSKGNKCELRTIAARLGIADSGLYPMPNYIPYEDLNPFIVRDLSKCILCGRCIRADHELVVAGAIDYNDRGFASRPATLHELPLESSSCTFCGTCVSMCPTGALSTKNKRFVGTPEKETDSICGFCSAGCTLSFGVIGNRVVEVNPSKTPKTANNATLCVRGHFAHDFLNTGDRLTGPRIRTGEIKSDGIRPVSEDGKPLFRMTTWDSAIGEVATRLAEIRRVHGGQSIAFVGSSKCTNEENYLFGKIARVLFETNNIINNGSLNGHELIHEIEVKTHGTARFSPMSDLESAEAIICVCADPGQNVPVAGYHIRRAAKRKTPLIVIDPVGTDIERLASCAFTRFDVQDPYAAVVMVINGLASALLEINGADKDFIDSHTEGYDSWAAALPGSDAFLDASLLKSNMISNTLLKTAANSLKGCKITFVLDPDLLDRPHGRTILDAVFNMALATGSLSDKKKGFFILSPENNTVGSFDMGNSPNMLPGRLSLKNESDVLFMESAWGAKISRKPGIDIENLVRKAEEGKIKALYIMGENLLRSLPEKARIRKALEQIEFIVVQDIIENRTISMADVVLAGAAAAEKTGSFTNLEGKIQTFSPVVHPPGEALPDWMILGLLAKKMGYPEQYNTIENIRQEIRRVIPMYADMGNHRREWVKNKNTKTPFTDESVKFSFSRVHRPESLPSSEEFPYYAMAGPLRWHLGCGTRTSRSERITDHIQVGAVEISTHDIDRLGLRDKKIIRIHSRAGAIERDFVVSLRMPKGIIFIPLGFNGNNVSELAQLEPEENTTGCRFFPVRIEPV